MVAMSMCSDTTPGSALPRDEKELTQAEREGRDRAWNILEPIVQAGTDTYDRKVRGRLIAQVVESGLAVKETVYTLLYRYWKGGQTLHALIPRYEKSGGYSQDRTKDVDHSKRRGRPTLVKKVTGRVTGINVDEDVRKKLVKIGEEFFESDEGLTEEEAFRRGLSKYFRDGYDVLPNGVRVPILLPDDQLPTLAQFRYWYGKAKDPDRALRKREGERAYNLKHRPMRGDSSATVDRPGAVYQVDATIGDVYLVSSRDPRLIIGRPVIYVVIDQFSRLVVGFTVGLEGPSWMAAMLTFENVATDKVAFCRSLDISITPDVWAGGALPGSRAGRRRRAEEHLFGRFGGRVRRQRREHAALPCGLESHRRAALRADEQARPPLAARGGAPDRARRQGLPPGERPYPHGPAQNPRPLLHRAQPVRAHQELSQGPRHGAVAGCGLTRWNCGTGASSTAAARSDTSPPR